MLGSALAQVRDQLANTYGFHRAQWANAQPGGCVNLSKEQVMVAKGVDEQRPSVTVDPPHRIVYHEGRRGPWGARARWSGTPGTTASGLPMRLLG